ncbi:MAG: bifunctional aspartate kinase/homoserine dehydrogenase I [Bacteroidales bacterium]|nr:bifunctional aspartate kinase/homoserine dehydrogenase I [Bacteroidales bacterium]
MECVKSIIDKQVNKLALVVSAFGDSTDVLISISELAAMHDLKYEDEVNKFKSYILTIIKNLFGRNNHDEIVIKVTDLFKELEDLVSSVYRIKNLSEKIKDKILSYGEYISASVIHSYLKNTVLIDASQLIKTDSNFGKANVDFEKSNKLILERFKSLEKVAVIPGFIGSNDSAEITTLGRGGSDYSASIIAAALNAEILEIWTDVDGFMTADPKIVEKAFAVKQMSYAEAMELSHFGAKVIYTPTIQPVYQKKIKVVIKNAFNQQAEGTVISATADKDIYPVKGVSSINDIDFLTIHGPGMVGVKGTSGKLFSNLAKHDVNIILITQASSEYSISFAIDPYDTKRAIEAIEEEFKLEITEKNAIKINVEKELSIVAIVGEGMRHTPGISANLFQSLGRNGINVIGIAQGSSELNISVVIKKSSLKKALNVIHEGFFLSHYKEIHLFLIGTGVVGGALINQLKQQQKELLNQQKLNINLIGIADIDKMIIEPNGINFENCLAKLKEEGKPVDLKKYTDEIIQLNLRNSIFVDCTASKEVSDCYYKLLNSFISVVAANKIACSSEMELYRKLKKTALDRNVKFMYETNVGAGLPIINTINNLINSGDKIIGIEAVLSGTLNFVFNEISGDVSLSKAILKAKELGFSEPDPRIDLSGIDVVRKILILSREAGYPLEQKDVKVKTFLPAECFEGTLDDFWKKVKKYDNDFEERRKELEKSGKKWRFVASLNNGNARVELKEVDASHPSYPLVGSNNIILLTTTRYKEQPMIIRGYGAGAEVTAAGVFGDIMQVAHV